MSANCVTQDGPVGVVWALVRGRTRRLADDPAARAAHGAHRRPGDGGRRRRPTHGHGVRPDERFHQAHDVLVNPDQGSTARSPTPMSPVFPRSGQWGEQPGWSWCRSTSRGGPTSSGWGTVTFAAADEHILRDVSRPLVTDGRLPDQDDPTELLMEEDALDAAGLEVGDTIDTAVPTFDEVIAYEETGLQGPIPWERIEFTIVGAGRSTNDIVVDEEADLDAIWFTQAFYDDHRDSEAFFGLFVELRPGATEDDLRADIEGLVPDEPIEFQATPRSPTASSERCDPGHRRGGVALLVAVTGLLLIGQAVGRLLRADDLDLPALRAAG